MNITFIVGNWSIFVKLRGNGEYLVPEFVAALYIQKYYNQRSYLNMLILMIFELMA